MAQTTRRPESAPDSLFQHLRQATQPAHRTLEQRLNLLSKPILRSRLESVLQKFLGFHRVWEPSLQASLVFEPLMIYRTRRHYLETDLKSLGVPESEIASLPLCRAAAQLCRCVTVAMGSLYVMQGSTLGGEVIARVLRREPWVPVQGLQYFSPPDRDARSDWIALEAWAESRFEFCDRQDIEQGAQETFKLMDSWLSNP